MPIITKRTLLEWLDPASIIEEESQFKAECEASGPGQMDAWLYLQQQKNCFRKREAAKAQETKKKIILSTDLMNEIINNEDLDILAALTTHFEFYIWPGNKVNFNSVQPIKDVQDLMQQMKNVKPFSKEDVAKSLSMQGIKVDDYKVLDLLEFYQLQENYKAKFATDPNDRSRTMQDAAKKYKYGTLRFAEIDIEKVLKNLHTFNTKEIVHVIMNPLNEKHCQLFLMLPNVKIVTYRVVTLTSDTRMRVLPNAIVNKIIEHEMVVHEDNPGKYIYGTKEIEKKYLQMNHRIQRNLVTIENNDDSIPGIYVNGLPNLKDLKIQTQRPIPITISDLPELHTLTIRSPTDFPIDFLDQFKKLRDLKVADGALVNLKSSSQLKILDTEVNPYIAYTLKDQTELEELTLRAFPINPIRLTLTHKKLKKLTLMGDNDLNQIQVLPGCAVEELSVETLCKIEDSHHLTKLKKLSLANLNRIERVINLSIPSLEEITLYKCRDLAALEKAKSIKKLHITTEQGFLSSSITLENHPNIEIVDIDNIGKINLSVSFDLNKFSSPTVKKISLKNIAFKNYEEYEFTAPKLEVLEVSGGEFTSVDFSRCPNLKVFKLHHACDWLKFERNELVQVPGNIGFNNHSSITEVEIIGRKPSLLCLLECPALKSIVLKDIEFRNTEIKEEIALADLPALESLTLSRISISSNARPMINLNEFKQLKSLNVTSAPFKFSGEFLDLENLEELRIDSCNDLKSLDLSRCKKLRLLEIRDCDNLTNLRLPESLLSLEISDCKKLEGCNANPCTNLKNIRYTGNHMSGYVGISECKLLERVVSEGTAIDIGRNYPLLKVLSVGNVPVIDLSNVELPQLEALGINSNEVNLSFDRYKNLRALNVTYKNKFLYQNVEAATHLNKVNVYPPSKDEYLKLGIEFQPRLPAERIIDLHLRSWDYAHTTNTRQDVSLKPSILQNMHRNNNSPVARYNPTKKINVHDQTAGDKPGGRPRIAAGEFVVNFKTSEKVYTRDYRIDICDSIKFQNDEIDFSTEINEKLFIPAKMHKEDHNKKRFISDVETPGSSLSLGLFEGKLLPGTLYALPSLTTGLTKDDYELYCAKADNIETFWHPEHEQHYIRLKPGVRATAVEIYYKFPYKADHKILQQNEVFTKNPSGLLPKELINRLDAYIKSQPRLSFLQGSMSTSEKMARIIDLCNHFKTVDLPAKTNNEWQRLLTCITENIGVCSHRAQVCMVLGRYIGVPVRIINNENHVLTEVPYMTGPNSYTFKYTELGGGFMIDQTPAALRVDKLAPIVKKDLPQNLAPQAQPQPSPPPLVPPPAPQVRPIPSAQEEANKAAIEEDRLRKRYQEHIKKLTIPTIASEVDDLFTGKLSPLIELSNQTPFNVNTIFARELHAKNIPHVFIDRPSDFINLYKSNVVTDGKIIKADGPLRQIIQKGGVIVVNWSNFNATEIASYKSILDKKPTLFGEALLDNVKTINLKTTTTKTCAAFISRCRRCQLSENFYKKDTQVSEPISQESIQLDLFNSLNWRERLLGKVSFKNNRIQLEDGPLIEAIKKNKPLHIINKPDNEPELETLIYRVTQERKLFHNGEPMSIRNQVAITTGTLSHPKHHESVLVTLEDDNFNKNMRMPIYLGMYNWHECFENPIVKKDKSLDTETSLLSYYDSNKHYFYITESIAKHDWQELIHEIKTKYPNKNFEFVLAPGVSIYDLTKNDKVIKADPKRTQNMILTNDPDFQTQQIAAKRREAKEDVLVIDLTPTSNFKTLFAEMKVSDPDDLGKVEFSYEEKLVLEALKGNKTVILNGPLTPSLYQRILPLLSDTPHILSNGVREDIGGKLICVQSLEQAKKLNLQQYETVKYELKDYEKMFEKSDWFPKIKQFYDYAKVLPHTGLGRPALPEFNQAKIKNIIHHLDNASLYDSNPNKSNPIKGIFHYDYPKDSADYAYLNVIAKILFFRNVAAKINFAKLNMLAIKNPHDLDQKLWQVLNTLPVVILNKIFDGDFFKHVLTKNNLPTLKAESMARLWDFLDREHLLQRDDRKVKQRSHVEKRMRQLDTLLKNENTRIIVIKGPPGVGKTETIRYIIGNCFEGEAGIAKWLAEGGVLLLDEANMHAPGTFDFLKRLALGDKEIVYGNKRYPLTAKHKVMATVNPEDFPDRFYHSLFQDYAETVRFEMPEHDYLESTILGVTLTRYNLNHPSYTKAMLTAFQKIRDINPTYVYSIRDLENLVHRFVALANPGMEDEQILQILYQCCVAEFVGTLDKAEDRQIFKKVLQTYFAINDPEIPADHMIPITQDVPLPGEKKYIIDSIEQDLSIRLNTIRNPSATRSPYKHGVLIEGAAGLGKSTLLEAILVKNGFSKDAIDTQKKYYVVTVEDQNSGSEAVKQILKKAFHEGAAIVLDELNLDAGLEKFINDLLTGIDDEGMKPLKEGFFVCASQNPGYLEGRKASSSASRNRLHVIYMEDYSPQAMRGIAAYWGIENPKLLVETFQSEQKQNPDMNMRTFYTLVEDLKDPQVHLKKELEALQGEYQTYVPVQEPIEPLTLPEVEEPIPISSVALKEIQIEIDNYINRRDGISTSLFRDKRLTAFKVALAETFKDEITQHSDHESLFKANTVLKYMNYAIEELAEERASAYKEFHGSAKSLFKAFYENWPNVERIADNTPLAKALVAKIENFKNGPIYLSKGKKYSAITSSNLDAVSKLINWIADQDLHQINSKK